MRYRLPGDVFSGHLGLALASLVSLSFPISSL